MYVISFLFYFSVSYSCLLCLLSNPSNSNTITQENWSDYFLRVTMCLSEWNGNVRLQLRSQCLGRKQISRSFFSGICWNAAGFKYRKLIKRLSRKPDDQHNQPECSLVSINVFLWDSSRKLGKVVLAWKNQGDTCGRENDKRYDVLVVTRMDTLKSGWTPYVYYITL